MAKIYVKYVMSNGLTIEGYVDRDFSGTMIRNPHDYTKVIESLPANQEVRILTPPGHIQHIYTGAGPES